MSSFDGRFVAVALVVVFIASSVATGLFVDRPANEQPRATQMNANVQPSSPDPDLEIQLEHRNITSDNETQFVLFLGNREENEGAIDLTVQIKIQDANGSLDALVDNERGRPFGNSLVWYDEVDLDPSEYQLSYGAIADGAEPGTYLIRVTVTYLKPDGITWRSVNTTLIVTPGARPTTHPTTSEPLVEWIQEWLTGVSEGVAAVLTNAVFQAALAALGALATLAALLVELYGRESFFNALAWPVRRVRGTVRAHWPFGQRDSDRDEPD